MEFVSVGPLYLLRHFIYRRVLHVQPNLNIAKLKRKMDISGLTLQIAAENVFRKGRFYMLWKVFLSHLVCDVPEPATDRAATSSSSRANRGGGPDLFRISHCPQATTWRSIERFGTFKRLYKLCWTRSYSTARTFGHIWFVSRTTPIVWFTGRGG